MAWPDVPAGWVTAFGNMSTFDPPSVEIRVLDEGVGWNVVTDASGVKLISHDPIEQKIDWFSFGGTNKSKEIRFNFSATSATDPTQRNTYFDNGQGNVLSGMPFLVRISFDDSTWRTVFTGQITGVELTRPGEVVVTTKWHFDWWLENRGAEEYWALTPQQFVTNQPIPVRDGTVGQGSWFLNGQASNFEKFTDGNKIASTRNWPATYHVWADGDIPADFFTDHKVVGPNVGSASADYQSWSAALTIYTYPKDFYTQDWMVNSYYSQGPLNDAARGLNWVGTARHPGLPDESPPVASKYLYSIYPPHLIYGGYMSTSGADHPFTLDDEDGDMITTGAAVIAGPDNENWKLNDLDGAGSFPDYCWSYWRHPKNGMSNWTVVRQDGGSQDNVSPSPDYNGADDFGTFILPHFSVKERNESMFGDARDGANNSLGDQADPWMKVCYCPAQGECRGWSSLKVQDSDTQQNTQRAEPLNVLHAVIDILGGYERPPVPEIDGDTEYDLQPAFAGGDMETTGYVQTTGAAATVYSALVDVPGRFLEDESRIPLLQDYLKNFAIGIGPDVIKPEATFKGIVAEVCKTVGLYIYASPFGQLDFDLIRPLDSGSAGYWDSGSTTLPVFRSSLDADAPNSGSTSDRNSWNMRWKDRSDKQARTITFSHQYIDSDYRNGTTELATKKTTFDDPNQTWMKGQNDLKFSSQAIFGVNGEQWQNHPATQMTRAYGDQLGEVSWTSALRYFSDDVTRTGTGVFLRIGRPCAVHDSELNMSKNVSLTGIALNVVKGTMTLTGVHSDNDANSENCYPDTWEYDYGNQAVGPTYAEKTLTITNDSPDNITGTITLNAGGENRPFEIMSGAGYTALTPGSSHNCVIRFHPPEAGAHLEFVDLGDGCGVGGVNNRVLLRGVGIEVPIAAVQPPKIDFQPWYIGMYLEHTATITNVGYGTLTGTYQLVASDCYEDFRLVTYSGSPPVATEYEAGNDISLGGGSGLGHGEADTIYVRCRPTIVGELDAHIAFDCNVTVYATEHPDKLVLSGYGLEKPDCWVDPHSLNFGAVLAGGGLVKQIGLGNWSDDVITGTAVIHQAASGPYEWHVGSEYTIGSPANGTTVTPNGDDYDYEIPVGGAGITWNVHFNPSPAHHGAPWPASIVFDGSRDCWDVTCLGTVIAQDGNCTVDELSLNWGEVVSGEAAENKTVNLDNTGGGTMTGTAEISQAAAAPWAIVSGGTIDLAQGSNHDVVVSYTPSGGALTDFGHLKFTGMDVDHECLTVAMIGRGLVDQDADGARVSFGEALIDVQHKRYYAFNNPDPFTQAQGNNLRVNISSNTGNGNDIKIVDPVSGSAVNEYTIDDFFAAPRIHTVRLYWLPSTTGTHYGSITLRRVTDADVEKSLSSVIVTGLPYTEPYCDLTSGALLNFGEGAISQAISPTQQFVLYGRGGGASHVLSVAPAKIGTNAADFSVDYYCSAGGSSPYSLAAGQFLRGTVTATPGGPGMRQAGIAFGGDCGAVVGMFCWGINGKADYSTWSPDQLSFAAGATKTQSLDITQRNTSAEQVISGTAEIEGSTFLFETPSDSGSSTTTKVNNRKYTYVLQPGETITWPVKFSPLAVADYTAEVKFTGDVTYTLPIFASATATRSTRRPDEIPGLVGWYHTDYTHGLSNDDPVATWHDKSGMGNDATQSVTASKPIYKTNVLNGYGVMDFNGTSHMLTLGDVRMYDNADGMWIVAVVKWTGSGTEAIVSKYDSTGDLREWQLMTPYFSVYDAGTGTPSSAYFTLATGSFKTVTAWWGTGEVSHARINEGTTQDATGSVTDIEDGLDQDAYIGARRHVSGDLFTGQMAEICIYDHKPSTEELDWLDNWLQTKYGHY